MPPKPKFTKEQVILSAYQITREKGIEAVTASALKQALNTSASPLFTLFSSMDEIKEGVYQYAKEIYINKAKDALNYFPAFKQMGNILISYAYEEPHLFELLFMQKNKVPLSFEEMIESLGQGITEWIKLIQEDYGLDEKHALFLFKQIWIYSYGVCVFCAKGICRLESDEINQLIGNQFMATLDYIISGKSDEQTIVPKKKNN